MTDPRNPVLAGFHPDPSVVRVGEAYYLATSSFEYLPGIPIHRSTDLRTWELIGHVATRPGQLDLADVWTGAGAWAPTLRHHDGRFWLVITVVGQGCLLFSAADAAGPWSDPVVLAGVEGIDPDLAWDEDGTCYLTYSGLMVAGGEFEHGMQHLGIQQVRIDPVAGVALEEPRSLWSGTGGMFPEAPHLYRIDGHWYLMLAEGGTERGHAITIARGPGPMGPFEGCPHNPVLTARGTDRPVQNTGHGDLVQRVDGRWFVFCLGVRTRSMTRAFSPMGRETFASPVTWVDGWPVMAPVRLDAPAPAESWREDFADGELPSWALGIRRFAGEYANCTERPGWLVVAADGSSMADLRPTCVAARQRHERMRVTALVDASKGVGGLVLRIDEAQWTQVVVGEGSIRARVQLHQIVQEVSVPWPSDEATLCIRTDDPYTEGGRPAGPDTIIVGYLDGDTEVPLLSFDGRYLSAEVGESFVGRAFGVVATAGRVAVDWLHYDGVDAPRI